MFQQHADALLHLALPERERERRLGFVALKTTDNEDGLGDQEPILDPSSSIVANLLARELELRDQVTVCSREVKRSEELDK